MDSRQGNEPDEVVGRAPEDQPPTGQSSGQEELAAQELTAPDDAAADLPEEEIDPAEVEAEAEALALAEDDDGDLEAPGDDDLAALPADSAEDDEAVGSEPGDAGAGADSLADEPARLREEAARLHEAALARQAAAAELREEAARLREEAAALREQSPALLQEATRLREEASAAQAEVAMDGPLDDEEPAPGLDAGEGIEADGELEESPRGLFRRRRRRT